MKSKTTYHITYLVNGELKHYFTNRIVKARGFISNNFYSILSCWREIKNKKGVFTERVFRNIAEKEPRYYFNNKIKAVKN